MNLKQLHLPVRPILTFILLLNRSHSFNRTADARQQVIANLANFAYNPENFGHLFRLAVHQLFWRNIDSTDDFVALSSLKGLCNFAPCTVCLYEHVDSGSHLTSAFYSIDEPIALFCSQANILEKVFNCMKDKMWSADFVLHSLLLLITLRLSQHTTLGILSNYK